MAPQGSRNHLIFFRECSMLVRVEAEAIMAMRERQPLNRSAQRPQSCIEQRIWTDASQRSGMAGFWDG